MTKGILCSLFIGLMCSLHSCTKSDIKDGVAILVDDTNFKDWSALMEIEDVVSFQATASSPKLSVASKCVVGNQQILFWDYKAKLVYAYDTKGKYLFTVGGIGQSDREYVDISDVNFSPDQQEIHLLDVTGVKIYNANNGSFIKKRLFRNIESTSIKGCLPCGMSSYLLFTPDNEYSICKVDSIDNITPLRKRNGYQMLYNRFVFTNGEMVVLPDYGQFTVDYVCNNNILPAYAIDLGEHSLPQDKLPNNYGNFVQVDDMKDYFKVILSYYENNNHIYASIVGPNQSYYDLLYAKGSGKVYVGPHDEDSNIVFTGMDNDYLYGLVYLDYVNSNSPYYDLLRKYKESDTHNPILLKIKIQER